jgi:transcription initiation factor TFIID subunit TAF12
LIKRIKKSKGNKMIKTRKKITKFFESIICIKNEGIYKVVGVFGVRIKIKNRHEEILNFLWTLKQDIDVLRQQQQLQQQQQQQQQQLQQQQQQQLQTQCSLLQQLLFYIEKDKNRE